METNNNYVYAYEFDGRFVYYGIGSYTDQTKPDYKRASAVHQHREFCEWFGDPNDVQIVVLADRLTRRQALLIESSLIFAHRGDLFNRKLSTKLYNSGKYLPRYGKASIVNGRRYWPMPSFPAEGRIWNPWLNCWIDPDATPICKIKACCPDPVCLFPDANPVPKRTDAVTCNQCGLTRYCDCVACTTTREE